MTSLLSLSLYPQKKKKKKIYIGIKKIWDVQMSQLVSVPIWRVRVPLKDEQSEREEHDWQTPYRKHPWYQNRSRQGAGWTLILRHEAQSLASVLRSPSGEKPIALPSQEGGAPRIIYALTGRNGLWAWVSVCTSNVLFGPGYVVKLAW